MDPTTLEGAPVTDADIDALAAALEDPGPWRAERIGYFSALATTGGLWRFTGRRSSCVLKLVRAEQVRAPGMQGDPFDPASFTYWRREPDVYARGTDDLLPGIRMPALVQRRDSADRVLLWLEEVTGRHDRDLTEEDLRTAVHALGRAQASSAAPSGPPWSAGALREVVTPRLAFRARLDDDDAYDHPDLVGAVGDAEREANRRLIDRMEAAVDLLDAAPQVLCHHDFWSANIFLGPHGDLTLLDWAHTGPGAVGTDVAVLVSTLIGDRYHPVEDFPALLESLSEAYVAGLDAGGWEGDLALVPRLIALACPARFLGAVANLPRLVRDPDLFALICTRAGWQPSDFVHSMARFAVLLDEEAERAWRALR